MAKFEKSINGDFSVLLKKIESGILDGSITATLEGSSEDAFLNKLRKIIDPFIIAG